MKVGTSALLTDQTTKLGWSKKVKCGISVTLEFNNASVVEELHTQNIIVSENWAKRFKPLHAQDQIGTT